MTTTAGASAGSAGAQPVWSPDPSQAAAAQITRFAEYATTRTGTAYLTYLDLWAWSVEHVEEFWPAVWDFFDIVSDTPYGQVITDPVMPGAQWFPGTRLNYAEHALRGGRGPDAAVISIAEGGETSTMTWQQLREQVAALAHWLRGAGVRRGDRVVGYLPTTAHSVVALLAAASVGAVWSACGQDYGHAGAAARFSQLDPVVLFAADGYRWNGRAHDRRGEVQALSQALPTLRSTVYVPNLGLELPTGDGVTSWDEATGETADLTFERVDFGAPLWVLFSSGTTGSPKGIVHGHGGVLLEHYKLLGLHFDLRPGQPFFWYTTTNWMMWNLVASGLLLGSTIILYDGSPTYPGPQRLWEIAAGHRVEVLGVSPGYLLSCGKAGLEPGRDLDLGALRILGSTGAPLPAEAYLWVHDHVGSRVQVVSAAGGTDVVSAFAGSAPTTEVWAGEISAPMLGVALQAWDDSGHPIQDEVGELVIIQPMPSMPLYFWNDPDNVRYREAYFSIYPGIWRHGDWVTQTARGSIIVSGRSDSTLNRQGVRLGSADIYDVVEKFPQIREALVIGAELSDGGYWMPLFLVLEPGLELDDDLRQRINTAIRTQASPRHVPDEILSVPAIPHTRTGKKLEVPIKRLLQGATIDSVVNKEAIDNLDALSYFARYARPAPRPTH